MTGTARHVRLMTAIFAPLVLAATACGAPTTDAMPAASPAQAAPMSPPGGPSSGDGSRATPAVREGGAIPAGTAVAAPPASPGPPSSWPFAPAPSPEELKGQLDRLAKDPGPIRTNWTPPGKRARYGRAEALIGAPYDVVRARLLDFPHYNELAGPKFKKVSLVEKGAAGTELYFKLPIMKGIVTLWYVTRFSSARPGMGGAEIIEGTFVKGNIKDMHFVFTVRPGPDHNTILVCDLNLAIHLPAPQELLDEELRDACADALKQVRARTAPSP